MKKILFTNAICFLFFMRILNAQVVDTTNNFNVNDNTPNIETYDLNGCLKFALQNSEALRKAKYNILSAKADVGERLSIGLPQISAGATFTDNVDIRKTILPPFSPPFNPGSQRAVLAFGAKYNGDANIGISQLIFDFSYLLGVQAARMYANLTEKQVDLTKIDIVANVTKAYYGVLVNEERLNLLDLNLIRLDTLLSNTNALYKSGLVEKIDVMRLEVSRNNFKTEREKLVNLQALSKAILKYQMGMKMNDSLTLKGNLREITMSLSEVNQQTNFDYKLRTEYEILKTTKDLQQMNLRYTRSLYLPSLRANAAFGYNTGTTTAGDYFKFKQNWVSYGVYNINLNIPIFDGRRKKFAMDKIRIEMIKAEDDIKFFARTAEFQAEQSKISIITALKDLEIQSKNMELAQEIERVAKVKYQNGTGASLEIINAQASFKEAENNYYVAMYNAVIAKVDLDKATGKLKATE
ncbi:MAG: TolC family protein [Bacteroidetes bacterium]|nr:MAG: TolC family protein [Bacteroidota bacterium]TAG88734.1 MAG: TolC family protein [Bacteroidota bacterium]